MSSQSRFSPIMTDLLTSPTLDTFFTALRCSICYNTIQTAMCLPCSHTYCSTCIRRSIQFSNRCPTCNRTVEISQLRNSRNVDLLIEQFDSFMTEIDKLMNAAIQS